MATEDDEKKAKDAVIDPATRAELERWFGLPSFADVEAGAAPGSSGEDPGIIAAREQMQRALAAVDPVIVARHKAIYDVQDDLLQFEMTLESMLDPSIMRFDETMTRGVAEPREYELDEALIDDMRECAPQAILRDLHRVETDFTIALERPYSEEQPAPLRTSLAREMMATRWQVDLVSPTSHIAEGRAVWAAMRTDLYADWSSALPDMPNRRVSE